MSLNKLNIQTVCSYFHVASTLLLFCSIPFYFSRFTQYGMILFFSSFVIDYVARKRWREGFRWDKSRIVSLFLLINIALFFIYSFFEVDTRYFSTLLEYRASFIGFAVVGLLGVSDKFKTRYFAYAVVIALISYLLSLYNTIPSWVLSLENVKEILTNIAFFRSVEICSHMTLNIFLCVGMILFSKLITISKYKAEKVFSIFMILALYLLVMLSEGRVGMLNANIVMLFIILRFAVKKLKYLVPIMPLLVSAAIVLGVLLFVDNPLKKQIPVLNKANPREYIWHEGINQIEDSPIIGKGASTNALQMKERLLNNEELCSTEKFLIRKLNEEKVYGMHPHNQIMQSWQEYGIIGLLTILGLFISLFIFSRKSISLCLVTLIILIQLQFEVIDGGITTLGFCTYIYLILVLLSSNEFGKEEISGLKWIFSSPSNA